jgi:hypothetical protein
MKKKSMARISHLRFVTASATPPPTAFSVIARLTRAMGQLAAPALSNPIADAGAREPSEKPA